MVAFPSRLRNIAAQESSCAIDCMTVWRGAAHFSRVPVVSVQWCSFVSILADAAASSSLTSQLTLL